MRLTDSWFERFFFDNDGWTPLILEVLLLIALPYSIILIVRNWRSNTVLVRTFATVTAFNQSRRTLDLTFRALARTQERMLKITEAPLVRVTIPFRRIRWHRKPPPPVVEIMYRPANPEKVRYVPAPLPFALILFFVSFGTLAVQALFVLAYASVAGVMER